MPPLKITVAGAAPGSLPPWDWFVLAHLGFFFLLLACLGWAAWGIWRRTSRPEPHLQLMMELDGEDEEKAKPATQVRTEDGATRPDAPWERPADWWKDSSAD